MALTTTFIAILIATFLILSVFQFYIQSYVQPGAEIQGGVLGSSQKCVTGTATSSSGIKYGNYRIYSDLGSNSVWARIIIKDSKGKTVDTHIVNQGDSYYSSATGLTIRVYKVSALQDGTIVGVVLYIGTNCNVPTTTTTTTTSSIQYKVCTYVNPNNINGSFYLNGQTVYDGQIVNINPNVAYPIAANVPSGYNFVTWTYARSVNISNPSLANASVVFGTSGWDGTCVGNLGVNYQQVISTITTSTTTIPPTGNCVSGTVTATSSVSYGSYKIYSDLGSNNAWARIIIKDSAGNTVDTRIINVGNSWDYTALGLRIKILNVAALQDGTVVGTTISVGPLGVVCFNKVQVSVYPIQGMTAYYENGSMEANLNGLAISADQPLLFNAVSSFPKPTSALYILFGAQKPNGYPVMIGTWNNTLQKVMLYQQNQNVFYSWGQNASFYAFTVGGMPTIPGKTFQLTLGIGYDYPSYILYLGSYPTGVQVKFRNTTATWNSITPPSFRLGSLTGVAEADEIIATINGTAINIGTMNSLVQTDIGWTVIYPAQSGTTDSFVVSIPV
jgi:hypothetical protein